MLSGLPACKGGCHPVGVSVRKDKDVACGDRRALVP